MNKKAYFGDFGGQFIPETAMFAVEELESAYKKIAKSKEFKDELNFLLKEYVGRPTPLYHAKNLSKYYGHEIYLKREDLNHTGAHKINNALAQTLLAKKMGKKKVIAETGAGQHGVATATAAALLGLECDVYMGEVDAQRQELNKFRMKLLGANVVEIKDGLKTLKEATTAAIQAWVNEIESVFYVIGSVVGPYPYPTMVRDFQSIIGHETKSQLKEKGINADYIIACVGGGSNAMGIFSAFLDDKNINPRIIAQDAKNYITHEGIAWSFFKAESDKYGINVKEIKNDEKEIKNALKNGPLVVSVRHGYFTNSGHIMVIDSYEDGKLLINDPNSIKNTKIKWPYEDIKDQIANVWAFSK